MTPFQDEVTEALELMWGGGLDWAMSDDFKELRESDDVDAADKAYLNYQKNLIAKGLEMVTLAVERHIITPDEELITPEVYDKLYPRRSMKADAAVHYKNKAIAARNQLRSEQLKKLREEK